jgi:hypothetical protein
MYLIVLNLKNVLEKLFHKSKCNKKFLRKIYNKNKIKEGEIWK